MRSILAGTLVCLSLVTPAGRAQEPSSAAREPGKTWPWVFNHIYQNVEAQHATPADLKAIEANLLKLVDVFKAAPMLNPPMGFDIRFTGTLAGPDPDFAKRISAMAYDLEFAFMDYLFDKTGRARTGTFPDHGLEVYINDPYKLMHGSTGHDKTFSQRVWTDNDGEFWIEPPSEDFHGVPIIRLHDLIALARNGASIWRPVPAGRFLPIYLAEKRKDAAAAEDRLASAKKAYDSVTSPAAEASYRKDLEAARAGKNADQELRRLEKIRQRRIDDAKAEMTLSPANPKHEWYFAPKRALADAESLAASLGEAGRKAAACITGNTPTAQQSEIRLVPDGTPGCHRLVEPNLGLFDNKLPRTAIQLVVVKGLVYCEGVVKSGTQIEKSMPGGCPGTVRLTNQLDWQRLASLVGK